MQTENSMKRSMLAMLLVLTLVFSLPVELFAKTNSDNIIPVGHNDVQLNSVNGQNIVNLSADAQAEVSDIVTPQTFSGITSTDDYKDIQEMPENENVVIPEEIIPEMKQESTVDADAGYKEKSGVTVIPALLNNFMRDSLSSIISKKVYTFSVDTRGVVIYAFNHMENTARTCLWYITLYEEYSPDGTGNTVDYRVINRTSYEKIGESVQSAAIGVLPGNYRVEVECISGFTEDKYNIMIGFAENFYYEAEPNDTNTRYNELPLGVTMNGSASQLPNDKSDVDTYLFRITEKGYTVLYFEHENDDSNVKDNVAWRITLTDEYGNEYFYTSSTMEKAMLNSGIMGLPEGYYYVTVSSHMYTSVSYSLNVSFTKDSAIEQEFNDTFETAEKIAVNTEKVGSITSRYSVADKDYFAFTMNNDGFIILDFIHEATADDKDGWNITLLDKNGKVIYNSVSNWNQEILQTPNIGLTRGDYFIRIDSDDIYHNSMVYRLILLTVQNTNWETEPNNIPADADILTLGTIINGALVETGVDYDRDWFKVTVESEKELNISFSHIKTDEPGKEGWIVSLVDMNGNILRKTSVDWDVEDKSLSATVAAGEYYILIETGLYFNSNRYILVVN